MSDDSQAARAWSGLAPDYERARSREDSLDRLVDLAGEGVTTAVGVDISGNFISETPPGLELIQGDLNGLDSVPGIAGRTFDRILFLQSFGYARDPVGTLQAAREMLAEDGFILLTRTHPIRYAIERTEPVRPGSGSRRRPSPRCPRTPHAATRTSRRG